MSVSTIFSNIKMVINTYMFSWTYALNTLDVLFLVFKFVNTSWLLWFKPSNYILIPLHMTI